MGNERKRIRKGGRGWLSSIWTLTVAMTVGIPMLLGGITVIVGARGFQEFYRINYKSAGDGAVEPLRPDEKISSEQQPSIGRRRALYLAAGLAVMETTNMPQPGQKIPTELEIARVTGCLVPLWAFVLLLWGTLGNWFRLLRVKWWQWWNWRWPWGWNRYAVVCGLGWKGHELARDLHSRNYKVLVLDKDVATPFRSALPLRRTVFLPLDATSIETLLRTRAYRARRIYVVTDDDEANSRIVKQFGALVEQKAGRRHRRTDCFVHIEDEAMRVFLEDTMRQDNPGVFTFNTYETTARRLLSRNPLLDNPPKCEAEGVHVVVFGNTDMARALIVQCLRLGHFRPNQKLVLTSVHDVEKEGGRTFEEEFFWRFPSLDEEREDVKSMKEIFGSAWPTIRFVSRPGSDFGLFDKKFQLYDYIRERWITQLYVCIDDGFKSASMAKLLHSSLRPRAEEKRAHVHIHAYCNYPEEDMLPGQIFGLAPGKDEPPRAEEDDPCPPPRAFGNFLEEVSLDSVEGRPLDLLGQQIHLQYRRDDVERLREAVENLKKEADRARSEPEKPKELEAKLRTTEANLNQREVELRKLETDPMALQREWLFLGESDRRSNLIAADHVQVKLGVLGIPFTLHRDEDRIPMYAIKDIQAVLDDPDGRRFTNRTLNDQETKRCSTWIEKQLGCWRPSDGKGAEEQTPCGAITSAEIVLAEMEHRRWCMEKVLDGWCPLPKNPETEKDWKKHKANYKKAKLHIDLVPFLDLIRSGEFTKDIEQVRHIARYLQTVKEILDTERAGRWWRE